MEQHLENLDRLMEQHLASLEQGVDTILNTPLGMYLSFGAAVLFIAGGIVLYKKRGIVRGLRWPGTACMLLGCASLATKVLQYLL